MLPSFRKTSTVIQAARGRLPARRAALDQSRRAGSTTGIAGRPLVLKAGRITRRYLAGGFDPTGGGGYNNSTSVVGFTTCHDLAGNKAYERSMHAEERSSLYLPIPFYGTAGYGTTLPAGYDSLNRLQQYQRGTLSSSDGIAGAGGGSVTEYIGLPKTNNFRTYNLDGLGNWKSTIYSPAPNFIFNTVIENRQHNSVNEVTSSTSSNFDPPPSYTVTYDHGSNAGNSDPLIAARGNGNIANDGTLIYAYDALNRLIQVNSAAAPSTIWANYTYDALGRRIRKQVQNGGLPGNTALNGVTDYLYDGQRIIEDRSVAYSGEVGIESTVAQYVWGMYIDELIQMKTYATLGAQSLAAGNYYQLSDLLYRSIALTSNTGAIVEAYDTDAYGNTLMFSASGSGGNWFGDDAVVSTYPVCTTIFTGRQYDPETLLYYYRARYYNPPLGRFVGRDSIFSSQGYAICGSNPVFFVDPFGLEPLPIPTNPSDNDWTHIIPIDSPLADALQALKNPQPLGEKAPRLFNYPLYQLDKELSSFPMKVGPDYLGNFLYKQLDKCLTNLDWDNRQLFDPNVANVIRDFRNIGGQDPFNQRVLEMPIDNWLTKWKDAKPIAPTSVGSWQGPQSPSLSPIIGFGNPLNLLKNPLNAFGPIPPINKFGVDLKTPLWSPKTSFEMSTAINLHNKYNQFDVGPTFTIMQGKCKCSMVIDYAHDWDLVKGRANKQDSVLFKFGINFNP